MVKCVDCGYLAARNRQTGFLDEVDENHREQGRPSPIPETNFYKHEERPVCFVRAYNLHGELKREDPEEYLRVINRDRDCPCHIPWKQGYTPREHQEMIAQESLLKFQAEQRDRDRQYQEEQRARDRKWQLRQNWWTRAWGLVCIVAGALLGYFLKG